jgi:hypothetical protein
MTKAHRLATRKSKLPVKTLPLNFLLGCSQKDLEDFELARLVEVANVRKEVLLGIDRLIDQMSQAALAAWFRAQDRQTLKHAIENEETPLEWADRMIREGQRSGEELDQLFPQASLPVGAAHLAAALRYQERNIADGKCAICPQPLDHNSVRYCVKHLAAERNRHKPKDGKDEAPGSIGFLYQDHTPESRHGREPSNLARLEMNREKKTRTVLAELGIPPESAAVSLKAATEALLVHMPDSKAHAMTQDELFTACMIPSRTTGHKALLALLSEGKIQRIGKGGPRDLFRYHAAVRRDSK